MQRATAALRYVLPVLGLVPVGAWLAIAANLDPGGMGRSIGIAILVILSPLPVGGLLMIVGAGLLGSRPRAGRIVATIGAGIVGAGAAALAVIWMRRFTDCGVPAGICTSELLEALAGLGYALLHLGLIFMVWRFREAGPASAQP